MGQGYSADRVALRVLIKSWTLRVALRVMDSLGHVYVTTEGSLDEQVSYGKQDIFLLKYDWMGRKLWTK
eukprot:scaffold4296_cov157-Ochromonas_danica.AAC.4